MIKDIWNLLIERSDFFLGLLLEHLEISVTSILIAIVLGLVIGIVISEYQGISKLALSVINLIYTIPSISLLGFLIPFSGIGDTTAIVALTIYALLPMVRNTHTGMVNIDERVLEAAKGMGSTRFQILYKIKFPLALPVIMSGIRNMVTMTIALAGIASFIGAGGLGVAIYRGITTNNTAMTVLGSALIAVLALIMDFIFGTIERTVGRRSKEKKHFVLWAAVCGLVCFCIAYPIFSKGSGDKLIHIATKPMTEQYVMGEMLSILIEQDTDYKVALTQGVGGGTSNIQPAMENKEFDLYPEYTGTGWNMVLKNEDMYDESMFSVLQSEYAEQLDMEWVGMYGFNNTYGIAVRKEIADEYGIETYSDLAKISDTLVFGGEYDFFEREDGYEPLCKEYGFQFKKTVDLDIGLKYQAINQKNIDVMNIFTTDGQLSVADITVLVDDRGFYPSYRCGNVVRKEVLQDFPKLKAVLEKLENVISDDVMANLNYQVETEGKEPREAAEKFLESVELIE